MLFIGRECHFVERACSQLMQKVDKTLQRWQRRWVGRRGGLKESRASKAQRSGPVFSKLFVKRKVSSAASTPSGRRSASPAAAFQHNMERTIATTAPATLLLCLAFWHVAAAAAGSLTELSKERLVFQTTFGDIHMAFYPNVGEALLRRWAIHSGMHWPALCLPACPLCLYPLLPLTATTGCAQDG